MGLFDDAFDAGKRLGGCACGRHASQDEHLRAEAVARTGEEARLQAVVESTVMRALFPQDAARRAFLKSVGAAQWLLRCSVRA